jgi:hypothetical protein
MDSFITKTPNAKMKGLDGDAGIVNANDRYIQTQIL